MMYNELFRQRLKEARQMAELTQQEAADDLEISRENISKYETGNLEPSIEMIGRLAALYHVDISWLFGTDLL